MQQPEDQFGDKLGWLIAFAMVGGIFIYAVLQFPSLQAMACDAKETSCFRDWLSALGGWAAVAAAIPTVYYLQRQVRAAADYQRINFSLSVRANTALASAAIQSALEARHMIEQTLVVLAQNGENPREITRIKVTFDILAEILKRQHFIDFETKIISSNEITNSSLVAIIEQHSLKANELLEYGRRIKADENFRMTSDAKYREAIAEFYKALNFTDKYLRHVCSAALDYIEEIKHLGSRIS